MTTTNHLEDTTMPQPRTALGSHAPIPPTHDAPGATLYYETRGSGPLLALLGTPDGTETYAELAELLASKRTVLTYDPRGTGRSTSQSDNYDDTPELRASDLHHLLATVTDEPIDLFGSSGGAMTGLALVTANRRRVRRLVAHEPPVITALPDAAEIRTRIDEVVTTAHTAGAPAAWARFLTVTGMPTSADGNDDPRDPQPDENIDPDGDYFLTRMLPHTPRYYPDLQALWAADTQVLFGVGADSGDQLPRRATTALAARLHNHVTEFPGGHLGYLTHPDEFGALLDRLIPT
nr:alpha/beta hydrolase [Kibdelosporangium sp. MJ126-NF4]CEL17528.1 putative hydrolase [Kibdelosporangium sp. MJ126-NF4]CTQ91246.1 putative hydrolase [Kibdelosporangium sp. MJ126-NF4]